MKKLWLLILLALPFNLGAQQMRWDIPSSSVVFPTNFWSASTSNVLFIVAPSLATKLNITDFQAFTNSLGTGAFAPTNNFDSTQFIYAGGQWHFITGGSVTNVNIYGTVSQLFGDLYTYGNIFHNGNDYYSGIAAPSVLTTDGTGRGMSVQFNTKGSLLVSDGIGPAAIPVGSDGQILMADSAAIYGVSWRSTNSSAITGLTNAGNASFSIINSSNGPVPKLKSLSFTNGITATDQGTNIAIVGAVTGGTNIVATTNGGIVSFNLAVTNSGGMVQRSIKSITNRYTFSGSLVGFTTNAAPSTMFPVLTNTMNVSSGTVMRVTVDAMVSRNGVGNVVGLLSEGSNWLAEKALISVPAANYFESPSWTAVWTNSSAGAKNFVLGYGQDQVGTVGIARGSATDISFGQITVIFEESIP